MKKQPQEPLILITGASSGIGQALALYLSKNRSVRLLLCGRNRKTLNDLRKRCLTLSKSDVDIFACDIANIHEVEAFCGYASKKGEIFAIVNNAGIGMFGATQSFCHESWEMLVNVNLTAPFVISKLLYENLISGNSTSSIINICSDAGHEGFFEAAGYCATKGGLVLLSKALRKEWRSKGIRITTISPGRVDTHFNNKQPGMRVGALTAESVAQVIDFAIFCDKNIEFKEILFDSMNRLDE